MYRAIVFILFIFSFLNMHSQLKLDEILAVIGDEIILKSDIEQQSQQLNSDLHCDIYQDLIFQKILINQAKIDSVEVSDEEVYVEVENRIDYFISALGSVYDVENYYNKNIDDIRKQLFIQLKDQFLIQRLQYEITNDINASPLDIINFYKDFPKDSLPVIPGSVEFARITISPQVNSLEESRIKDVLNKYKERIEKGEDFSLLAALYSEDLNTSSKGGYLGFLKRSEIIPEFEIFVYSMNNGEISPIIKSSFGYHIVKLISREGESLELSHILLKPNYNDDDIKKLKLKLDSIKLDVEIDSLTFGKAAFMYSEDTYKNNNGLVVNTNTGSSKFAFNEVSPNLLEMSNGEISDLQYVVDDNNNIYAMKIEMMIEIIEEHMLDIENDYSKLYEIVSSQKKNQVLIDWIKDKEKDIFIELNNDLGCKLEYNNGK